MALSATDLGEAVEKLSKPEEHTSGQTQDFYGLCRHLAKELTGRPGIEPAEYYKAALGHRRGNHIAPSVAEITEVAKIFFPTEFGDSVLGYIADMQRTRRPPK